MKINSSDVPTHRVVLLRVLVLHFVLSFGTILVGESASRPSSRRFVEVSAAYSLGSLPLECFVVFVEVWVGREVSEVGHVDPTSVFCELVPLCSTRGRLDHRPRSRSLLLGSERPSSRPFYRRTTASFLLACFLLLFGVFWVFFACQ